MPSDKTRACSRPRPIRGAYDIGYQVFFAYNPTTGSPARHNAPPSQRCQWFARTARCPAAHTRACFVPSALACPLVHAVEMGWQHARIRFPAQKRRFTRIKRASAWPSVNRRVAVQSFHFCAKRNRVSRSPALGQARFGLIDLAAAQTTVRAVSAWRRATP